MIGSNVIELSNNKNVATKVVVFTLTRILMRSDKFTKPANKVIRHLLLILMIRRPRTGL